MKTTDSLTEDIQISTFNLDDFNHIFLSHQTYKLPSKPKNRAFFKFNK